MSTRATIAALRRRLRQPTPAPWQDLDDPDVAALLWAAAWWPWPTDDLSTLEPAPACTGGPHVSPECSCLLPGWWLRRWHQLLAARIAAWPTGQPLAWPDLLTAGGEWSDTASDLADGAWPPPPCFADWAAARFPGEAGGHAEDEPGLWVRPHFPGDRQAAPAVAAQAVQS